MHFRKDTEHVTILVPFFPSFLPSLFASKVANAPFSCFYPHMSKRLGLYTLQIPSNQRAQVCPPNSSKFDITARIEWLFCIYTCVVVNNNQYEMSSDVHIVKKTFDASIYTWINHQLCLRFIVHINRSHNCTSGSEHVTSNHKIWYFYWRKKIHTRQRLTTHVYGS